MAVARSYSDGVAIRYLLPALWMASRSGGSGPHSDAWLAALRYRSGCL